MVSFQSASEAVQCLAGLPFLLRGLARNDVPAAVAAMLDDIYKLDIEGIEQAIAEHADQLTAACVTEGAVRIDGETYPNSHAAAVAFAQATLRQIQAAVDPVGMVHSILDSAKRLPPEQVELNWAPIRVALLAIPDYDDSALEARIARERVKTAESAGHGAANAIGEQLPTVEYGPCFGEISFRGDRFSNIPAEACQLLQELIDAYPQPKGLTTDDRPKPDRIIKQLPTVIRNIIDTSNKGSKLDLSNARQILS